MEKQAFNISLKSVWFLMGGSLIMTLAGAMAKIFHLGIAQFLLLAGLMFLFAGCFIVLSDMAKQKIHNKALWIISVFIFPSLTPLVYLIQRKHIIIL